MRALSSKYIKNIFGVFFNVFFFVCLFRVLVPIELYVLAVSFMFFFSFSLNPHKIFSMLLFYLSAFLLYASDTFLFSFHCRSLSSFFFLFQNNIKVFFNFFTYFLFYWIVFHVKFRLLGRNNNQQHTRIIYIICFFFLYSSSVLTMGPRVLHILKPRA